MLYRRPIRKGIISTENYAIIDTIPSRKYRPIFVGCLLGNGVAISENQR
ncbi:SHOCT domain-containing protein [Caproicibacterium amylolyticum]